MPRVFLNDQDRACHRFTAWVRGEMMVRNVTEKDLADEHGMSQPAISYKFKMKSFNLKDFVFLAKKFEMDKDTFDYIIGN